MSSPTVAEVTAQIEAMIRETLVGGSVLTEEKRLEVARRFVDDLKAGMLSPDARHGLKIICDETNNTEADRDAGILNYTIVPPPMIVLDFTILRDGTIIHKR